MADLKEKIQVIDQRARAVKQTVNENAAAISDLKSLVIDKITEVVDVVGESNGILDTSDKIEEMEKKMQCLENDLVNISDTSLSNYATPETTTRKSLSTTQERLVQMAEPSRAGQRWSNAECKEHQLEFDFDKTATGFLPLYKCFKCDDDFHGQNALIKHANERTCCPPEARKIKENLKKNLAKLGYVVAEPEFSRENLNELKRAFLYVSKSRMKNLTERNMYLSSPQHEWNEKLRTHVTTLEKQGIIKLGEDESAMPHLFLVNILEKMTAAQILFETGEKSGESEMPPVPPSPEVAPSTQPSPAYQGQVPTDPHHSPPPAAFNFAPFTKPATSPPKAMPSCPYCNMYAVNLDMLTLHLNACDQKKRMYPMGVSSPPPNQQVRNFQ